MMGDATFVLQVKKRDAAVGRWTDDGSDGPCCRRLIHRDPHTVEPQRLRLNGELHIYPSLLFIAVPGTHGNPPTPSVHIQEPLHSSKHGMVP